MAILGLLKVGAIRGGIIPAKQPTLLLTETPKCLSWVTCQHKGADGFIGLRLTLAPPGAAWGNYLITSLQRMIMGMIGLLL